MFNFLSKYVKNRLKLYFQIVFSNPEGKKTIIMDIYINNLHTLFNVIE